MRTPTHRRDVDLIDVVVQILFCLLVFGGVMATSAIRSCYPAGPLPMPVPAEAQ